MELNELTILQNLVMNDEYARKVLPYIDVDFFQEQKDKKVFELIYAHLEKYNVCPSKTSLMITLNELNLQDKLFDECVETVKVIEGAEPDVDINWLVDYTEQWCKDKALYNAIMKSIEIVGEDGSKKYDKGTLPKLLQDALAVSFDTHIGHDFIDNSEERFDFYQQKEERLPFHLDRFNAITKGGLPRKTLNIALAGTGVGKSLFMCDCAANHLMIGKNVLYITLEMSEEKIAERIDANLLNVSIQDVADMSRDLFNKKIERIRKKTTGTLIVKEYPTAAANTNHFRHLITELQMKKNFTPDIIYVDYLNISASARLKYGANVNSYTYIKSIAEELRGLAVEFNVPIMSATQTTRSGFTNSDIGLEDTSESFGLPATADLMFALISTEELKELDQILVKQLKNRYNDLNANGRFVVGIDRSKMRLYDAEESAQDDLIADKQDKTGSELNYSTKFKSTKIGKLEVNI